MHARSNGPLRAVCQVMTGVLPYKVNADFFQLTNPDHVETTIKSTLRQVQFDFAFVLMLHFRA